MIFFPNAKINLGLYITDKRKDGYHNLETIFYPISLTDILELQEKTKDNWVFNNTGIRLPDNNEHNLCYIAYEMIKYHYSIPDVNFHLHKIIPYGSGLGGGSADASFTLKALNELFHLNITNTELKEMAEQIGSDCPFFFDNQPSFAWQKGNRTEPVSLPTKGLHLLLVVPNILINTKMAYRQISPRKRERSLKNVVEQKPVEYWNDWLTNDFEENLLKKFPEMKRIKDNLIQMGAIFTSLSGSGAAMYGLFKNKPEKKGIFSQYFTWTEKLQF